MLNTDYEKAYISSFTKIFRALQDEYEVSIKTCEYQNYEVNIKSINKESVSGYLSICFQKQNGSLTVIAENSINDDIVNKLVRDISLALDINPISSYNFKDLNNFTIYHFCYVIQDPIIDNKKIIEDLANSGEIENINYDLDFKKHAI